MYSPTLKVNQSSNQITTNSQKVAYLTSIMRQISEIRDIKIRDSSKEESILLNLGLIKLKLVGH